jgi:hypothetical protein
MKNSPIGDHSSSETLAHPINMTNKSVKVEIKETGCEVWTGFI